MLLSGLLGSTPPPPQPDLGQLTACLYHLRRESRVAVFGQAQLSDCFSIDLRATHNWHGFDYRHQLKSRSFSWQPSVSEQAAPTCPSSQSCSRPGCGSYGGGSGDGSGNHIRSQQDPWLLRPRECVAASRLHKAIPQRS